MSIAFLTRPVNFDLLRSPYHLCCLHSFSSLYITLSSDRAPNARSAAPAPGQPLPFNRSFLFRSFAPFSFAGRSFLSHWSVLPHRLIAPASSTKMSRSRLPSLCCIAPSSSGWIAPSLLDWVVPSSFDWIGPYSFGWVVPASLIWTGRSFLIWLGRSFLPHLAGLFLPPLCGEIVPYSIKGLLLPIVRSLLPAVSRSCLLCWVVLSEIVRILWGCS